MRQIDELQRNRPGALAASGISGAWRGLALALALGLLLGLVGCGRGTPSLGDKTIPQLNWEPRSDWVNVKTDVTPAAKGDGETDDTAALQAALDGLRPMATLTLYFPPGVYRLTQPLVLRYPGEVPAAGQLQRLPGVHLIGCGRDTVIRWDGEVTEGAMFWNQSGLAMSRVTGLVWDGRNRAAIGLDMHSTGYDTGNIFEHLAFLNFTGYGIRNMEEPIASAEANYRNCLFRNCGVGLGLHKQNVLNHQVDGCEFSDCGYGIQNDRGGVYVRNSHFARSTKADLHLVAGSGCSVRRCTSLDSEMFIFRSWNNPLVVQECTVSGWRNPEGAIVSDPGYNVRACTLIMDCSFLRPPNATPPLRASAEARVILSGNTVEGDAPLWEHMDGPHSYQIPGTPHTRLAATQSFLQETARIPGKVFDAKRDFGAAGDGRADDTAAIQQTVDAARNWSRGAIAYLPRGCYLISATISITGADYSVGGSGERTELRWAGLADGVMVRIQDPNRVTLENISVGTYQHGDKTNAVDILQVSTPGARSFMTYDDVFTHAYYDDTPGLKGLHLQGLSAESTVLLKHYAGNLTVRDSAQARILANAYYGGSIVVEGKDPRRGGFLGFSFLGSAHRGKGNYTLNVHNNQSLVACDLYIESVDRYIQLTGEEADPLGRVTILSAKQHFEGNPFVQVKDYGGQIQFGPGQWSHVPKPAVFEQTGTRPCDLLVVGTTWLGTVPSYQVQPSAQVLRLGNFPWETGAGLDPAGIEDSWGGYEEVEVLDKIRLSFDDLRRLGQLDLELNHPGVAPDQGP